ncbi:type I 3-dehydroquinate dehydratase [Kytococcus sedentarius]|uniref:type I 3-dehydroquinate dehydratase n=1 Tax=Kytococcus sedentarius TaxID=1276 RepID=UPI0035BBADDF
MTSPTSAPDPAGHPAALLELGSRRFGACHPAVAVPLVGTTAEELLQEAARLRGQPVDLVEWRLDHLASGAGATRGDAPRIAPLVAQLVDALGGLPLLATYRTRGQGGRGEADPGEYLTLVEQVAGLPGVHLVDVEFDHPERDAALQAVRTAGARSLVSHHDWDGQPAPEGLSTLVGEMRATGADAVKLATTPADEARALELLTVLTRIAPEGGPVAMLGMGPAGRLTRLVGPACGSFLTFARLGAASAPGQLDLALVAATVDALRAPERA